MKWLSRVVGTVGSPLDLAVLRIVVPMVVIGTPEFRDMVEYASVRPALRVVPFGFQTILSWIPPTPDLAAGIKALLFVSCLFAMLGLFARVSLAAAALLAMYGLGLAQIQGTVTHNHHLVWLLALLAASPCADVLSVDAWRKVRQGQPPISLTSPPTRAHSAAMLCAWLLIAIVFFFPGYWKWRSSGWEWTSPEHIRLLMYWKWYQNNKIPFFRLDHFPHLCRVLATTAILFEWTVGALLLFRRTRPFAVAGLIGFHAFTHVFLHIRYPSLWMCYVMFVDARAVLCYMEDKPREDVSSMEPLPTTRALLWPVVGVGLLLLGGSFGFGALGLQRAWPFACYPTFEWKPAAVMPSLYVEIVYEGQHIAELPMLREASASRSQKQWGIAWSLAGVTDSVDETRLRAQVEALQRDADLASRFRGARAIRVYRAWSSVLPEEWGRPPVSKVLLSEWPLIAP